MFKLEKLSLVMALAFLLFPSLVFASQREAMDEALKKYESHSPSKETGQENFPLEETEQAGTYLDREQAVHDMKKYWGIEEEPEEKGQQIQKTVNDVRRFVTNQWNLISQKIGKTRPETDPFEPVHPDSPSLQDYYDSMLERYQRAKELEQERKSEIQKDRARDEPRAKSRAITATMALARTEVSTMVKAASTRAKAEADEGNSFSRSSKKETDEGIDQARGAFHMSGGYNANHMHYKETRDSNTLNEDYGKLKGFYLEAGYRNARHVPWLMGRPFVTAYYRRYDDLITYDGGSSLGPLSFEEKAEVHRYGVKLGAYRDFLEKGKLFGYFDIGKRVWYRGENGVIQGVLTYAEKYWWVYYGLGAGINYQLFPRLSCGVDLEGMTAHKSQRVMRADLFEGARFHLGGVYGAEVKFPIQYDFLKNISLNVIPYFTYWEIHESDVRMISGSYYIEPDSTTHIEGVLVGLSYLF